MAIRIWQPGDQRIDFGEQQRLYPVPEPIDTTEVLYSNVIQKTSYIQASIVAAFDDWIRSFFPANYFKFTRIRTQCTVNEFKSFMKQIYKKDKPFLVIDPSSIEHVEDSIFAQNMTNRYNLIDPKYDPIGAKLLYSIEICKDDIFQLYYRRNRFRFEFNILIMEETTARQMDTYTSMLMNIRHNSKFLITRKIPHLLPTKHMMNIAAWHGLDYMSDQFLEFMNGISRYPITRKTLPGGTTMFFMEQVMNIQVETPGYPTKDSAETSNAIEWGARIQDNFTFIADLPSEFLLLTETECNTVHDNSIAEDPDSITYISPILAHLDWPTEIDGCMMTNQVDLQIQTEEDDRSLNIIPIIASYKEDIARVIMEYIERGNDANDLVIVKVHPNGSMGEAQITFDRTGVLTLDNPYPNKLYTACIYVNLQKINAIKEGSLRQYLGTVEKTPY